MKASNMNHGASKRTYPVASANNANISSHTKKAKPNEQSSADDEFNLDDDDNDALETLSQDVIEKIASRDTTKSAYLSSSKSSVSSSVFKGHTKSITNTISGNMPLHSTKTNYSTTKTGENGKRLRAPNPKRFEAVPAPMKPSQLTGQRNVSQSSSFNLTSVPSTCREDPKYIRKQASQIQVRAKRLKNARFKETMKKVVLDVDKLQEQKKQNIMQSSKPSGSSKQGNIAKGTKSNGGDHLAMGCLLKATKELEKCSIYTPKMKRINESFSFLNKYYTHYDT